LLQTRLIARNGQRRLVDGCCAPIHSADSVVIGMVFVFRDVTEHERLEQELVRATRLESVGILAGGIAHDFNNILTGVMGNLALAQLDIEAKSEAGTRLREAEKATLRARDLTQQLLTFAKGGEPVRAAVQLPAVVRETATFALHGSNVKPIYHLPGDLWPADADKGQIGRVVQNLVINAIQAMPTGGTLRLTARNEKITDLSHPGLIPGYYVQIAIADTGEGIRSEHLPRIFDPYFTTKQTGSGLGLAAVYSIIKKHRGHVDVDSTVGQGTTFRIWLPAIYEAVVDATTPPMRLPPAKFAGRVLFMDDEDVIRRMAVLMLQRLGFEVECAVDGAEAVAKYRKARAEKRTFTLVIMDLTVPGGMGGREAIIQLRGIDPEVKAVVSSGYSSDPVLANYRAHGFCGVVAKPYRLDDFIQALREALVERRS
jgi:signal transduction histidine kinase/ActR/RegA family two-component response regulator